MIDERIIELIHAGLDGELDDAGRADLEQALAHSEEARRYAEKMRELSAFLDRAPAPEVPESLRARIIERITLPAPRRRRSWFRPGQVPGWARYGLAAAAGLLLAVGIYEYRPGQNGSMDPADMVGSIMPGGNTSDEVVLDSFSFAIEDLSSAVSLQSRDNALVLDVRLDSSGPVDIRVDFTGDGLTFDAIAQLDSDITLIEVADQAVQVRGSGQQHFAVMLHRAGEVPGGAASTIRLDYSSAGKLLNSGKLTTK